MAIYRGYQGTNKEIKEVYRGYQGTNKEIKEIYRGYQGTNKSVFVKNKYFLYGTGAAQSGGSGVFIRKRDLKGNLIWETKIPPRTQWYVDGYYDDQRDIVPQGEWDSSSGNLHSSIQPVDFVDLDTHLGFCYMIAKGFGGSLVYGFGIVNKTTGVIDICDVASGEKPYYAMQWYGLIATPDKHGFIYYFLNPNDILPEGGPFGGTTHHGLITCKIVGDSISVCNKYTTRDNVNGPCSTMYRITADATKIYTVNFWSDNIGDGHSGYKACVYNKMTYNNNEFSLDLQSLADVPGTNNINFANTWDSRSDDVSYYSNFITTSDGVYYIEASNVWYDRVVYFRYSGERINVTIPGGDGQTYKTYKYSYYNIVDNTLYLIYKTKYKGVFETNFYKIVDGVIVSQFSKTCTSASLWDGGHIMIVVDNVILLQAGSNIYTIDKQTGNIIETFNNLASSYIDVN